MAAAGKKGVWTSDSTVWTSYPQLRAATSLARLWQLQAKRQNAYDLLTPVYNWFTEDFLPFVNPH